MCRPGVPWGTAVLCLLLVVSAGVRGLAADPYEMRYKFDNWKVEQGLPQNSVQAVVQTRDGYLWVGTRFGLARFDGVKFTAFTIANTPGMVSDNCTALAEDLDGSLWIGTDDGLLRWQNRTFTRYTSKEGLGNQWILSLSPSRAGGVWIGTRGGWYQLRNGKISAPPNLPDFSGEFIDCLREDRAGGLWIGTRKNLMRLDPTTGAVEAVLTPTYLIAQWCVYQDHAGQIWFSAKNGLGPVLYCWKNGVLTRFNKSKTDSLESADRGFSLIFEGDGGHIFACFPDHGSLHQVLDGELVPFPVPAWLENYGLNCFWEDHEHNFWLGSSLGGLMRMQPRRIRNYTREDGLPYNDTWSACEGRDGTIWVGCQTSFAGIGQNHVRAFTLPGNPSGEIKCVLEDWEGNLWLGKQPGTTSTEAGLYFGCGAAITNRAEELGISARSIRALYQDRTGNIWIGTSTGIYQYWQGKILAHYSTEQGLSCNDVRAFQEDQQGRLWIGTYGGGVNCLKDGNVVCRLTTTNGLSNNRAWVFHQDKDETLWIGTELGLNRYKNGQIYIFTRKQGLFDDLVNCILADDLDNLWISCNRGIYRVKRAELEAVAEGRLDRVRHVAYAEGDGMESSETNGENQPAGCRARDGRLYFPTTAGVVVVDSKTLQDNELPPPVVIEQVFADNLLVFGDRLSASIPGASPGSPPALFRLEPGRARVLEIHYTANSFVAPERMAFRYRLEPNDTEWQEPGNRRVAYYTNLRPGNYVFRVQACNNHGYWNSVGDSFSFHLAPHFYQTWPFSAGCVAGALLLAAAIQAYRLRVQRKVLGLEQQHALDLERDRIAQDMHDDLGANLTRIAILSEVAKRNLPDPRAAESNIEQISTTARAVVDNISELVWAANPRNDQLDNFASYLREYAAQFFDSTPIACRLEVQVPCRPLKAELRRNLFLVVKEALNNIVKHSGATQAGVTVSVQPQTRTSSRLNKSAPDMLVIVISDNGCGFDPANTPTFRSGLKNMRGRIAERGGTIHIQSEPGRGSLIRLLVPLP